MFTVSATFSDFTAAYEQYVAKGPAEALTMFILSAAALSEYDPESRAIAARPEGHCVIHVANGMRGLWVWHLAIQVEHQEVALYGGSIVQTDPSSPVRASSTA
jgi:hypothetical protein